MNVSSLLGILSSHPQHGLAFILPDGGRIPLHAHITEVGRVDKSFLDCGGTLRKQSVCRLQSWVADDLEHRLLAGKLAAIIQRASAVLEISDLEVDLEYEDGFVSQFPFEDAAVLGDHIVFRLASRHTDCLAKDVCLPQAQGCNATSGCC